MDIEAVSLLKQERWTGTQGRSCPGDRCKRQAPHLPMAAPRAALASGHLWAQLQPALSGLPDSFSPWGRPGAPLPSLTTAVKDRVLLRSHGKPPPGSTLSPPCPASYLILARDPAPPSALHFADVTSFTHFLWPVSRTIHLALCHMLPVLPLHVPHCNFPLYPSPSVSTPVGRVGYPCHHRVRSIHTGSGTK